MSWGVALRNAVGLGLGGIPSLLNAPPYAKLAFNFLSGELDPRITFSRTSNATLIGSDGTLQYAPHNLLTYSEQFDNALWAKSTVTVTANNVASPDGTLTADKVEATAADSNIRQTATSISSGISYTFSVYLRADTTTNLSLFVVDGGGGSGNTSQAVVVTTEWQRFTVTRITSALTTQLTCQIGGASSFSTGESVYVWGAQLNVEALQPYYSTTVKNLLGYTQEFDNAAWTKTGINVSFDATTAPDGSLTADKLTETAVTSAFQAYQSVSLTQGTVYRVSFYAKEAERNWATIRIGGAVNKNAYFNLATGQLGTADAGFTSFIQPVGGGWYRCSVSYTSAVATGSYVVAIEIASADNVRSYAGVAGNGIFIWGAQLSDSASLDPYVYNPAAAPSNTAYHGPRFDYDPVTLAPKGLLIEEQRTNLAINSGDVLSGTGGVVVADQITAPDGSLADFFQEDTNTSEHYAGDRTPSVTAGTTYTWSFYAKLGLTGEARRVCVRTGGQGPGSVVFDLETGGSTVIAPVVSSGISSAGNGWFRCWIVYTATGTGAAVFRQQLAKGTNTVYTGNGTSGLFFWGAQMEVGAFPTSYIPTTTAAATRAADVASVTGANFSNWYNPVEGTLLTTTLAINQTFPPNRFVSTMDDGTTNNIIGAYIATDLNSASFVVNGGVAVYQEVITTVSNTLPNSIAVTYKANDFMSAANGVLGIPDTSGAIPVVNKITFGNRSDGARPLNGHIRSFKYYPTRLSNGQLQTLTK